MNNGTVRVEKLVLWCEKPIVAHIAFDNVNITKFMQVSCYNHYRTRFDVFCYLHIHESTGNSHIE